MLLVRQSRNGSPLRGSSILITSAPKSASCRLTMLPATSRDRSSTRMPSSGQVASGRKGRIIWAFFVLLRHARPCAGHPRLALLLDLKDVDGRDKPGHDGGNMRRSSQMTRDELPGLHLAQLRVVHAAAVERIGAARVEMAAGRR